MYYATTNGERISGTDASTPDWVLLKLYELPIMPQQYNIQYEQIEAKTRRCSVAMILTGAASLALSALLSIVVNL